jgi:hypothetical protein
MKIGMGVLAALVIPGEGSTRCARDPWVGEYHPNAPLLRRSVHFRFYSLDVLRTSDF